MSEALNRFAIYEPSGTIIRIVTCLDSWASGQITTELESVISFSVDGNDSTHWVSDNVLTAKQAMPLISSSTALTANGTDEAIISGIPAGVQVEWPDGQTDIVTDGEISFSVDLPGTYTFRFTAVPYLDKEITVEAIAAT